MDRRTFLSAAGAGLSSPCWAAQAHEQAESAAVSAGSSPDGPALLGAPVVTGPAPDAMVILQPLQRHATGYCEFAWGDGPFQRVDASAAGLLPFERYMLKFRLPPLPPGRVIRYRVTARTVGWVPVRQFVHGKIVTGEPQVGDTYTFRTINPSSATTSFVVWNDTHENAETLKALHEQTAALRPDFLLWNGDQSNDIHFEADMAGQFVSPSGLSIADRWPLAYVRGNHDVRGPQARRLPAFTGTPEDRYYYAFRSGPVAALVMDTGEDKADDHPNFAGLASFQALREEQAAWLAEVAKQPWFRDAPFRVLFCHLPLWWVRDREDIDWWEYSKVSRDAWLERLVAADVKLVVSGHTHEAKWMPPGADQPIGQLIGGGPQPRHATLIHGEATGSTLTLNMRKLDGTPLHQVTLKA